MKKIGYLFFFCLSLIACNNNQIYKDTIDLPEDHRWFEKDKQVHEFAIEDLGSYSVYLTVSHVRDTEMTKFPLNLEVVKPNGSIEKATITVDVSKTDCVGDICDINFPIKENLNLEKGIYKISFCPESPFGYVPNIIAVGVLVDKVVKE